MSEYMIPPCSGKKVNVKKGQTITIVDLEGGQVVDFFAEIAGNHGEFVSPGVTIDCNESLRLKVGNLIYSNLYRPMFQVLADDVGTHDLLHPCCRKEMYDFFYGNGANHANCFDHINSALGTEHAVITPINLFMHTEIDPDGTIKVKAPLSEKGDKIILKALENVTLGVAACSVSESQCNSGVCTAVQLLIDD